MAMPQSVMVLRAGLFRVFDKNSPSSQIPGRGYALQPRVYCQTQNSVMSHTHTRIGRDKQALTKALSAQFSSVDSQTRQSMFDANRRLSAA